MKCQVIICHCKEIIAACRIPEAYEDVEWMKDVRKYSKMGYTIDIKDCSEFKFGSCKCNQISTQTRLF